MHTPSEDDPGSMPLAVSRARAGAGNPLPGTSAEPAQNTDGTAANPGNGGNGNGGNGNGRTAEQPGRPQPQRPQLEGPQLGGPQLGDRRLRGPLLGEPQPKQLKLKLPQLNGLPFKRPRLSASWRRWLILVAWPLGLAVAGVALYLCYLALSRTQEVTSDGASIALQAWDMLHGNPLLRGWTVTDVSFYTTEVPEWAIVEWVRGLNADVLHAAAAITYTLVVLTAGLLGRGQAKGREGMVRLFISAGIVSAPQAGAGVFILVFQPDHTGTSVPLLLTWLVLDRAPRKWFVPPIIALMLAWAVIADQLILLIAVAPLAVVSAVRAYQILVQRREGWRVGWFDVSLLVAAGAGVEISRIVLKEISAHGGYTVLQVPAGVAPVKEMSAHLWLLVQSISGIYGADLFGMT